MSRQNNTTVPVHPGPDHRGDRVDQVRNGNRWRVAAIDPNTNRIAAERLSDRARVVFDRDYLTNHVTLGYAATVHSAQGVTADSCYAILGDGASRATAYVAMTRGRHNNEAFLYQRLTNEADHEHSKPTYGEAIHDARRGNKYSAAQHFRMILANDDRPRTVHAEAKRAKHHHRPEPMVDLLQRDGSRRRARQTIWKSQLPRTEGWRVGHQRITAATYRAANVDLGADGFEL
jgi:hypothetical protein